MLSVARVVSFALLVLSLFGLAQASVASRREATNAERLARGLGPAPPRRLYKGSRTNAARSAPSGVPSTSGNTGVIAIYSAGTTPSTALPVAWSGQYSVASSISNAFAYEFTQTTPAGLPTEIECANDPGYRLGGLPHGPRSNAQLGPANSYYVHLNHVDVHTVAGDPNGAVTRGKYELGYAVTTIFKVDPDTGRITIQWTNPDGSRPQVYVLLYAGGLYLSGDVVRFHAQTGAGPTAVQIVDLYFQPSDAAVPGR